MIYRCMSPRLQGLDILKTSKGVLQPEMNSWLIRERFWHASLNVGWTHFPLIRDKNLDQGNFDELWSSFNIGANFQCLLNLEKTLQFGELSNHRHICFIFLFLFFCPEYLSKFFSYWQYRKEGFILKFCINFALRICLSKRHLLI